MKKPSFTLAETLIVMGVIGVVAALTLPNLNQSTNNKEKVAKLQKIYSNLQDAFGRAEAVYGPYDEWFTNDTTNTARTKRTSERILEFMKISKQCTTVSACKLILDGKETSGGLDTSGEYGGILADGTSIRFYTSSSPSLSTTITVDIDGINKGPNFRCKDIFYFSLNAINGVNASEKFYLSGSDEVITSLGQGRLGYLLMVTWII